MKVIEANRFAKVNGLVIPAFLVVALVTQIPLAVTLGLFGGQMDSWCGRI